MIVVDVRGNGSQVRAGLRNHRWDLALLGRDTGAGSRIACWAPLLHPEPLPDPALDALDPPGLHQGDAAFACTGAPDALSHEEVPTG